MFDVTILNPPYDKNLHLKILERVIPVSEETVNISPTGWLKDLPAVYGWKNTTLQRFEDTVASHIKDISHIDAHTANEAFSIGSFESVDITTLDNDTHELYKTIAYSDTRKIRSVFEKVIAKVYSGEVDNLLNNIKISTIHGHPGCTDEFDIITPQYNIAKRFKPLEMNESVFENWWKSCQTMFMKYCNLLTRQGQHIHPEYLPYMKDYAEEWTDERFCEAFSINTNEWRKIENVMEKYK